jgi:hypothetical protein
MKRSNNLWRSLLVLIVISAGTIILDGCKKSKDDPLPEFINPADANMLSRVLVVPDGTARVNGDLPAASSESARPSVVANVNNWLTSNGSTFPMSFRYNNVQGNLGGFYLQIEGANIYFNIPYSGTSNASGTITLPIGLPTNVLEGNFQINFCIYDRTGRVSQPVSNGIQVLRLGTGALQISLSWDTATDQDLHVTDPSGKLIYWRSTSSSTGGQLDRDDVDGYGPENIFWTENAPDGSYKVQVHDYTYTSTPNNFVVTVNTPTGGKTYNGQTQAGSKKDVVTFTKQGDNYSFSN